MLTEYLSSGSLLNTSMKTWCLFESLFGYSHRKILHPAVCAIDKTELLSQVYILQATLFNNQPLISQHSFQSYAALIPVLHCICSALYVCEGHYFVTFYKFLTYA